MPSSRTLISSQTLASSAASVTFSSIPATYTDLVLRVSARTDRATRPDGYLVFYNNTSGSSSSATQLTGTGSAASSNRATGLGFVWANYISDAGSTSSTFGSGEVYIPNYAATVAKVASSFAVEENNATAANMGIQANLTTDTTAITSLIIQPNTGPNFVTGSSFYLYGLNNS